MPLQQDGDDAGLDTRLNDRQMLILYGSETGNSQDSAEDLERLVERLHFQTSISEMNDVELSTLPQYPLVIFVISTTGQGEVPKNALRFWKSLLRKRLPPNCLRAVKFTSFGLGDSSYSRYNWAVRKLHKRLEQLGAIEFYPRGEADERHDDGIDGSFLPWSISLRTYLQTEYPLPEGLSPIPPDVQLPPKFTIELAPTMDSSDAAMHDRDTPLDSTGDPNSAVVGSKPSKAIGVAQVPSESRQQVLDRTAAQFSHVDAPRHESLEQQLEVERMLVGSNALSARLSEGTANLIEGGIDILDRPNVLRDHPKKYSLDDARIVNEDSPPQERLPVPGAWYAEVEDNQRITPRDHWQDVRQLFIRIPRQIHPLTGKMVCFTNMPGDVLVMYPKNFPGDVQALIDLMGWGEVADKPFEHHARKHTAIYSRPTRCYPLARSTLRQLLLHNYDITSIPKRMFFEQIAHYTDDVTHQERLREFANPGHSDEFYDYTSRPRRSILEVLHDFPSVKIPYQHVPSIFPVIRGREYSIASGGPLLKDPDREGVACVELLIALVKYKTVLRKTRQGLCSRYIAALQPGTAINFTIVEKGIVDPNDYCRPLLAIGPGTGVAPIRSLMWDRSLDPDSGRTVLFFGGRNRNTDFYFESDWEDLQVEVFTAFSRDQKEKIYVQDRIREQAALVCDFVSKGSVVVLCGSSGKMPEAVRLALYDALVLGKLAPDRETAKEYFHKHSFLWEEVW